MKPEEESAKKLLEAFFQKNFDVRANCYPGDDPPDIICEYRGIRYAIEVTRANQQQKLLRKKPEARMNRDIPLLKMGKRIGLATDEIRKLNYLLLIQSRPSEFSITKWENYLRTKIIPFVKSGAVGTLQLSGAELSSHKDGHGWKVAVAPASCATLPSGRAACDIKSNIEEMLKFALSDKSNKLNSLTGYDAIGLCLINTYFFGDDIDQIRNSVQSLMISDSSYDKFKFIFYITDQKIHLMYGENTFQLERG